LCVVLRGSCCSSSDSLYVSFCLLFCFQCFGDHRDLHSFPTRRSSDLGAGPRGLAGMSPRGSVGGVPLLRPLLRVSRAQTQEACRSEEHTSELQSRENLVCRLLLEKKKTRESKTIDTHHATVSSDTQRD